MWIIAVREMDGKKIAANRIKLTAGYTILTEESASLPTKRETNMPSIIV